MVSLSWLTRVLLLCTGKLSRYNFYFIQIKNLGLKEITQKGIITNK